MDTDGTIFGDIEQGDVEIARELPRPEGRGFPRHRQNLHHRYVM